MPFTRRNARIRRNRPAQAGYGLRAGPSTGRLSAETRGTAGEFPLKAGEFPP
jgi:hypothetical protein